MTSYNSAALVGNALRDVYEDKITDLVFADAYLLSTLEKTNPEEFAGGNTLQWLVDVQPNTSYAVGSLDGDVLPDPSHRVQVRAQADTVNHYGSTGVTQDSIDRTTGGDASFYRVVDKAKDELVKDLRAKVNPQFYGPRLFTVTADSAAKVITLDSVQYIQVGDQLTVGNRTTEASTSTVTVVSKDVASKKITVDANTTVTAATSGAWYKGAGPKAPVVIQSLDLAASTGRVLHGIDSSTYPAWDGNVKDVSGATADEDDFIDLMNRMWERGSTVKHALTTAGIQKGVAAAFQSQKRFNDANSVNLKAGFRGLLIATANGEVPLVAERGVPKGRAYIYDDKSMRLHKGSQEFMMPPGTDSIWRWVRDASTSAAKAEFAATYRLRLNLLFEEPRGVGRLINCVDGDPVY